IRQLQEGAKTIASAMKHNHQLRALTPSPLFGFNKPRLKLLCPDHSKPSPLNKPAEILQRLKALPSQWFYDHDF
ncbi:MAG: hypothetical protein AAF202_12695, partial [Pseudomonadota bacterium]